MSDIRFPIDCPNECPYLEAWDMSIDDWTYRCKKLCVQIDGCDTWSEWLLPLCPIKKGKQDVINELQHEQSETLTDEEMRIFLIAMDREVKACENIKSFDPEAINLVNVCHEIKRKVKKTLWQ